MAARDADGTVHAAVTSVLTQTLPDLELIVIDDGSEDGTAAVLAGVDDPRLVVLTNERPQGLPRSLNRGLEAARSRYVARLDADDIAHPERLDRQIAHLARTNAAVVGCSVVEIDAGGSPTRLHILAGGPSAVRWRALFGSPLYHSTATFDRSRLPAGWPTYDPLFDRAQDYELWTRVLAVADIDLLDETLVYWRAHAAQVSAAHRDEQRRHQQAIAHGQIAAVAPSLDQARISLAWRVGAGESVAQDETIAAVEAFVELFLRFAEQRSAASLADVRDTAARAVLRLAPAAAPTDRVLLLRRALELSPAVVPSGIVRRLHRSSRMREERGLATRVVRAASARSGAPIRVTVVSPEPTPYRAPLFDLVAAQPEIDLSVLYAAETVAGRTWNVPLAHRASFLRGVRVPGATHIVRHEYPVTLGVGRALADRSPDVVVVSGWSTFAAQAAIAWCRRREVPYVLLVESHDHDPRAAWRRAVKGAVVPRVVRGAAGILVTGSLVRESMIARGGDPARIHVFANTVDVDAFVDRAEALQPKRLELRAAAGVGADDVAVLCVARLAGEKGLDTLLRAAAGAGEDVVVVLAGDGPDRSSLEHLAAELEVRVAFLGDLPWERIVESYVAADLFALLSRRETWGVVVNEAAACGLPLVLGEHVGAAADLLENGVNGTLVPTDDVAAARAALRRWVDDADGRRAAGLRSREIAAAWGYGPSVEGFLAAARQAAGRQ